MTLDKALNSLLQKPTIKRWVIALSGGLDSIVLLDLAAKYRGKIHLTALHINHNQQPEAIQWAHFCERQCSARGIAYHTREVMPDSGSEACLRDARYAAFESFLVPGDCLLLGHHADDQAETVLFRLLRAAGSKGLSGMPVARDLGCAELFRPLLDFPRERLEGYAKTQALDWVEDPSNQSSRYARNYLRHQVLAPLKEQWPDVATQISTSAKVLSAERFLLNEFLDEQLAHCAPLGQLVLAQLEGFSDERRAALFRHWLHWRSGQEISRALLERLWEQVACARQSSIPSYDLKQFTLYRYRGELFLAAKLPVKAPWPVLDGSPCSIKLAQGELSVSVADEGVDWREGMYLACADLTLKVALTGRREKTLKQVFKEAGIPPWWRSAWPVLFCGAEVVAIPSVGVVDKWREGGQKKHYMALQWRAF
ncbi:MAG: tRNA lysidine(34) synthetase TilS [Pseudomonadales bacterium]